MIVHGSVQTCTNLACIMSSNRERLNNGPLLKNGKADKVSTTISKNDGGPISKHSGNDFHFVADG